jgi:hypothetical protein
MQGGECDAAFVEMGLQQIADERLAGGVQARGWFIQKPERTRRDEQAGEREAPAHALAEGARRQIADMAKPDAGKGGGVIGAVGGPEGVAPESQMRARIERAFQAVAVV